MPWQRPNIGSRMNREVHVRIWERPEVRVLRATRQWRRCPHWLRRAGLPSNAEESAFCRSHREMRAPDQRVDWYHTAKLSCTFKLALRWTARGCVSAPKQDPTHKLIRGIELACRFASRVGSRSAPIGTPPMRLFCSIYSIG